MSAIVLDSGAGTFDRSMRSSAVRPACCWAVRGPAIAPLVAATGRAVLVVPS